MGLDSVQIIVDIEDCFGITIDDRAAENLRTVGELCNHVWGLVEGTDDHYCYNQIIYFRLRAFVSANSDLEVSDIHPHIKLSKIWSKATRKQLWPRISQDLDMLIPNLSKWLVMGDKNEIFPSDSIQDLVDQIVLQNFDRLKSEFGLNRTNVNAIVISILRNISGAERSAIVPNAIITKDLGID